MVSRTGDGRWLYRALTIWVCVACSVSLVAQESPYLYGIHDHSPSPQEYLNHLTSGGVTGWITATVAVGHNPGETWGIDFRSFSNQGHTVVCRINNGYCESGGTIPLPDQYSNFATRCANFVANSQGCSIWVIGNETNLAVEWPPAGSHKPYVSPQSYADCFRQVYNAIKAVRPGHKVCSQALAPFGGPYGPGNVCGYTHDGNPINWVQYMNQMLTAIRGSGPGPDGIAVHINSRGYDYADIHSTEKVNAAGQMLYFSFYVYKDWINYGIPSSMYDLPVYATECNGLYSWDGTYPESEPGREPYKAGWMQEIYAEINRWNTIDAPAAGKPFIRCVNMYRWSGDPWRIDGIPQKAQILADLDAAVAQKYRSDTMFNSNPPIGTNLAPYSLTVETDSVYGPDWSGNKAIDGVVSVSSKWVSAATAPPHWLALDLGGNRTVNGYIIRLAGAAGEPTSYNAEALAIQTATSLAGPWATEGTIDNSARASIINRSYITPRTVRYVRLYVTDAGVDNHARIPEFEVLGVFPGYRGDMDGDADVDQTDFGVFQACYTTVGNPIPPACSAAELDHDNAIGQSDFALFVQCLGGEGIAPPISCLR
ncbi:MAG: discoidin domain-containing protein [Phycisphaerae bacterium]